MQAPVEDNSPPEPSQLPLQLTETQRSKMKRMLVQQVSERSDKLCKLFAYATKCCICDREKHSCAWAHKEDRQVTGSWCIRCIRATERLRCTKNRRVLIACPDLKALILKQSQLLHKDSDVCVCRQCQPSEPKAAKLAKRQAAHPSQASTARVAPLWVATKRLRTKTAYRDLF